MSADSNGWRPISTAPKDGETVLLRVLAWGNPKSIAGYFTTYDGYVGASSGMKIHPTHWQPLPSPDLTPPAPTKDGARALREAYLSAKTMGDNCAVMTTLEAVHAALVEIDRLNTCIREAEATNGLLVKDLNHLRGRNWANE